MFFRELRLPTQKVVEAPTVCRFYAEKLGKITPKASDMPVTTKIYFDTRNEIRKKTNDYPYKLQVYCPDPKATRFYQTVYGATEEENQKLSASRLSDKLQSLKTTLQDIEDKAADAAHKLDPFCFDDFVRDYIKDNPHFDQARIKVKPQVTDEKDFDFTDYHKDFPILLETFDPATVGYVYQLVIKKKIVWGKM
jgi:integrase/recombinase XerD